MALRNGLLVHGPDALGRGRPRRRRQHRRRLGPQAARARRRRADRRRARRGPPGRGDGRHPARQARAAARPACPSRTPPSSARWAPPRPPGWRCAGAHAAIGGEAALAALSLAPSLIALRGGELAAYHGVEHKAIGAYEQGADDAARRHQGARPLRLAPDGAAAGRQPGRHRSAAPRGRASVAAGRRRGPARLDRRRGRGLRVVRAPRAHRAWRARCAGPGTSSSASWARASRPTSSSRSAAPRWPRSCASKRCADSRRGGWRNPPRLPIHQACLVYRLCSPWPATPLRLASTSWRSSPGCRRGSSP